MVNKKTIIYRLNEKDTGSIPYQISCLEAEVKRAAEHLKKNKKDVPCERALVKKNSQKRNYLRYLERRRPQQYQAWLEWRKQNPL
ncbi:MAG: 30S ribosomal protein S15 [Candidatus Moeniiplasma glomeromycotorum]|nr:30S ribosomal protein S15 [Candidatus Moeniiplasma glomeromycotorum]MCE8162260.1 30S ribosomal protein S15 [Candidatus Moeniiplasma glomeromycotorum]MCE8166084.1 30S ribosomal protein S15 [Candidatus Moeniiplasma glomeromycotorum]MCE8166659.1 30S ribosomal protein S15 [Candidatus Moeniiplasma glomeromycotorum]